MFEEKLRDVVGLYLDPPENAEVFSFDEKSQIRALDRTQPGLPMKKGRCGTIHADERAVGEHGGAFLRSAEGEAHPGAFTSVPHLEKCLREYLTAYNEDPRPPAWTKSVAEILEKVDRGRRALAAAA